MSLHQRIAEALGWSLQDVQGFSLLTLRELVRAKHPDLAEAINAAVTSGSHILEPIGVRTKHKKK